MLKVTPVVDVAMLKSVPTDPVAKVKVVVEKPLIEVVENGCAVANPSEDVATHRVLVPVVWRIIPRVPVALVLSRSAPERVRLPVDVALVTVNPVIALVPIVSVVAKRLDAVSPVEDAVASVV